MIFFCKVWEKNSIHCDLPPKDLGDLDTNTIEKREFFNELVINISIEDLHTLTTLNSNKLIAYSTILDWINYGTSGVFFVDTLGGTKKT